MRPEITTWQIMIRVWGILFSIMAASFLAKENNLSEIALYLTVLNIITCFGTGIYALISFMIALRNMFCPLCTLVPIFAHVVMISMGVMEILWLTHKSQQVLISWMDASWSLLELFFAIYTMLTLYTINNFDELHKKNIQNNPSLKNRRETDRTIETRR